MELLSQSKLPLRRLFAVSGSHELSLQAATNVKTGLGFGGANEDEAYDGGFSTLP